MSDHSCYVSEVIIFQSFYIRGCKQHWFVSKLKLVAFMLACLLCFATWLVGCLVVLMIGSIPTRRTVGSADAWSSLVKICFFLFVLLPFLIYIAHLNVGLPARAHVARKASQTACSASRAITAMPLLTETKHETC